MGCCRENQEPEVKDNILNLSGELKIWNEDGSIKTESLSEPEIWVLRAVLNAVNSESNPLAVNANAKATIQALSIKIGQNKPVVEGECTKGACGCEQ